MWGCRAKKFFLPSEYGEVYAVRHLTKSGPASYGYATFNLRDVAFVDVAVLLDNGAKSLTRTLVVQQANGKWYVHPLPEASPLLSDGLNDETASKTTIAEAYKLVPAH